MSGKKKRNDDAGGNGGAGASPTAAAGPVGTPAEEDDATVAEEGSEEADWTETFLSDPANDMMCAVDTEYIEDDFNLTGLEDLVPNFEYAVEIILNVEHENLTEKEQEVIHGNAERLYGLIHARFITTARGISLMAQKYVREEFGTCPRVLCDDQPVLPVGTSDLPEVDHVKLYCPSCKDIFHPHKSRYTQVDGAYFGSSFPQLFLMQYPEFVPAVTRDTYVPRVFGFRMASAAHTRTPRQESSAAARSGKREYEEPPSRKPPMQVNDYVGNGKAPLVKKFMDR
ncbi:casein kinase II subunit beta [Pelomyxa schiedti]|nr:casein kinase II subunit beta [Pelomyxa schiedti]